MEVVQAFEQGNTRSLDRLKNALIALLRKKVGASSPSDLGPITMIHSFVKLISKVLLMQLTPRLADMLSRNQNAFIRTCSIHDNNKYV